MNSCPLTSFPLVVLVSAFILQKLLGEADEARTIDEIWAHDARLHIERRVFFADLFIHLTLSYHHTLQDSMNMLYGAASVLRDWKQITPSMLRSSSTDGRSVLVNSAQEKGPWRAEIPELIGYVEPYPVHRVRLSVIGRLLKVNSNHLEEKVVVCFKKRSQKIFTDTFITIPVSISKDIVCPRPKMKYLLGETESIATAA
ncbi:uncharacterized protein BDR25DRAFT_357855 [Lindgomyces ingoldianus]|uniref:Uncharacterized protein n=1 Tax=Lindgomyces ingoldianus TaxID=673940 RepID=A0ACB6QM69_9PLEO|nr:uncharacterized protein BDR25DRAFT_357855 [Lindgomyces ingoldianus]KAF2468109.1 hypothetical protein BDR25DRAFT_357855 [Lindgomyces ingoldianus]